MRNPCRTIQITCSRIEIVKKRSVLGELSFLKKGPQQGLEHFLFHHASNALLMRRRHQPGAKQLRNRVGSRSAQPLAPIGGTSPFFFFSRRLPSSCYCIRYCSAGSVGGGPYRTARCATVPASARQFCNSGNQRLKAREGASKHDVLANGNI